MSSENRYEVQGRSFLITGGLGYLGRRLCQSLLKNGARGVHLADVRAATDLDAESQQQIAGATSVLVGDIRDADTVSKWVQSSGPADCVIHVCSFGMSGRDMLESEKTWQINVSGTENVCRSCVRFSSLLIYVSTVNVCFDGSQEIINGDETAEYASMHVDGYSASKTWAEQLCLTWPDLRCVGIRPYGIYGEGEERHFPRMIRYFKQGIYSRIGPSTTLSDWVHVDNLVHACLLADHKLRRDRSLDGKAFFIGDGEPVNTIDMCEPLWTMVSGAPPSGLRRLWLPTRLIYSVAWLVEQCYWLSARLFNYRFEPLLSRAEVNKVALTHYWKTKQAENLLGYRPIVSRREGLERMYSRFQRQLIAEGYPEKYHAQMRRVCLFIAILIFVGFFFVFVFLSLK